MATTDTVKIQHGYKLRGIEPPDLTNYDQSTRKLYWSWVVEFGLKRKDKELSQGLDKDGSPLRPISAKTRAHRRSAMTPSGKGDPSAPPLTPAFQKSRTRSLLAGRALSTHAEFYWRFDAFTGDSWAVVLSYQAVRGRDVFGLSQAGTAAVKAQSWAKWERWKQGKVRAAAPAKPRQVAMPQFSQRHIEHIEMGPSSGGGIAGPGTGREWGFSTTEQRRAYFTATAEARLPGRPASPKSQSPIVGPGYNRLLQHIWGGGQSFPGRGGAPPRGTPVMPKAPPKPKPAPPVRLPKVIPPAPPKPPPPAPPGPAGVPVRNALVNQAKGKTAAAINETFDVIAKVHGDGTLPKIPIKQTSGSRRMGSFTYSGLSRRPIDIGVSSKGDHPMMTATHEIGHFLENSGIPKLQGGSRIFELGVMKPWLDAVKASNTVANLKALATSKTMKVTGPDAVERTYPVDRKFVRYLLQHDELWARSYAQYIATKSGHKPMIDELNKLRKPDAGYHDTQWSDDDFKPIMKAIDTLFSTLGWIK